MNKCKNTDCSRYVCWRGDVFCSVCKEMEKFDIPKKNVQYDHSEMEKKYQYLEHENAMLRTEIVKAQMMNDELVDMMGNMNTDNKRILSRLEETKHVVNEKVELEKRIKDLELEIEKQKKMKVQSAPDQGKGRIVVKNPSLGRKTVLK